MTVDGKDLKHVSATIKYEADLRHENEMKRVKAELAGQAQVERENHDLRLEKIKLETRENRATVLEAVATVGSVLGQGFQSLLTDWNKLARTVSSINNRVFFSFSVSPSPNYPSPSL